MNRSTGPVKTRRRYDASGRRERALRTRATVLEVARRLFLRDGYAATTIAAVAAAAGVSPETIYKTFGGKSGLVREIQQTGLAGTGPAPAPARSDQMSERENDPVAILRNWATLATEVAPQTAPIMLLVRSAAGTDPDMATLLEELSQQRLQRMAHNARRLAQRGRLRAGLTLDHARDVLFAYTAAEFYELLVLRQGWTLPQYGDFLYRGMVAELLEPSPQQAS
jgi:AcrR family transcriptional regulator